MIEPPCKFYLRLLFDINYFRSHSLSNWLPFFDIFGEIAFVTALLQAGLHTGLLGVTCLGLLSAITSWSVIIMSLKASHC